MITWFVLPSINISPSMYDLDNVFIEVDDKRNTYKIYAVLNSMDNKAFTSTLINPYYHSDFTHNNKKVIVFLLPLLFKLDIDNVTSGKLEISVALKEKIKKYSGLSEIITIYEDEFGQQISDLKHFEFKIKGIKTTSKSYKNKLLVAIDNVENVEFKTQNYWNNGRI